MERSSHALGDVFAAHNHSARPLVPLKDAQVQHFIDHGYLHVSTTLDAAFHRRLLATTQALRAADAPGWKGNDCLLINPQLGEVLADPHVHGALTGLMGRGYALHPHRHIHVSAPGGSGEQSIHQDCQDDAYVRNCRPHWCMAFYYAQDVNVDLGPTAIVPGSHFYIRDRPDDGSREKGHWDEQSEELRCVVAAGTVVIIHFELWHRATANLSPDEARYAFKFPVVRMEEPTAPTWACRSTPGRVADDGWAATADAKSLSVWNWMRGCASEPLPPPPPSAASVSDLLALLHTPREPLRVDAAFRLARLGSEAVKPLVRALRQEGARALAALKERGWSHVNPDHTNPAQLVARTALVAVGRPAVPALLALLPCTSSGGGDGWLFRSAAADALGDIGPKVAGEHGTAVVAALRARLEDEGESLWVVRNAAEALGRFGALAAPALAALTALIWPNALNAGTGPGKSYIGVRHNAVLSIGKIGGAVAPSTLPAGCVEALEDCSREAHHVVAGNARIALGAIALRREKPNSYHCNKAGFGSNFP